MNVEQLTTVFRKLGAPDPELWAASQVSEGIPQLARFLFLRQAWRGVLSEDDGTWIGGVLHSADDDSDEPGAARALRRLLDAGADPADLTELVRVMQWQLLHHLCYLLEDPGDVEPEVAKIAWMLFQVDEDGRPQAPMTGLHESVLDTDPSGREMRPFER